MIGEKEKCPICNKKTLVNVDGLYECWNKKCGAYEAIYKNGDIWTHVKVPIGLVKIKKRR